MEERLVGGRDVRRRVLECDFKLRRQGRGAIHVVSVTVQSSRLFARSLAVSRSIVRIKLNNKGCLPADADKLFCARARGDEMGRGGPVWPTMIPTRGETKKLKRRERISEIAKCSGAASR